MLAKQGCLHRSRCPIRPALKLVRIFSLLSPFSRCRSVARDRPIAALLEGTEGSRLKQVAASTLASLLSSSAAIVRSGGDFPPDMPSDSLFYGVPLSSLPALLSSLPTAVSATPDNLYGGGPRGDTLARVVEVKTAVDLLRGVLDAAESRRQDHRASQVPLVCLGGHLWTCSKAARRAAVALCRAASEAVPLAAAHAGEDVAHAMLVSAVALGGAVLDMSASLRAALSQRGGGGAEGGVQAVWGEADTRGAVEERYEADKRDVLGHLLVSWRRVRGGQARRFEANLPSRGFDISQDGLRSMLTPLLIGDGISPQDTCFTPRHTPQLCGARHRADRVTCAVAQVFPPLSPSLGTSPLPSSLFYRMPGRPSLPVTPSRWLRGTSSSCALPTAPTLPFSASSPSSAPSKASWRTTSRLLCPSSGLWPSRASSEREGSVCFCRCRGSMRGRCSSF